MPFKKSGLEMTLEAAPLTITRVEALKIVYDVGIEIYGDDEYSCFGDFLKELEAEESEAELFTEIVNKAFEMGRATRDH
jgi:hypothetical protein